MRAITIETIGVFVVSSKRVGFYRCLISLVAIRREQRPSLPPCLPQRTRWFRVAPADSKLFRSERLSVVPTPGRAGG